MPNLPMLIPVFSRLASARGSGAWGKPACLGGAGGRTGEGPFWAVVKDTPHLGHFTVLPDGMGLADFRILRHWGQAILVTAIELCPGTKRENPPRASYRGRNKDSRKTAKHS